VSITVTVMHMTARAAPLPPELAARLGAAVTLTHLVRVPQHRTATRKAADG
jgi:hypothetical protein